MAGQSTGAGSAAESALGQLRDQAQRPQPGAPPVPAPGQAPGDACGTSGPSPGSDRTSGEPYRGSGEFQPDGRQHVPGGGDAGERKDIYSVPLQLQFNPAVLQLVNVDAGDFLSRDGQAVALSHRDEGSGMVTISTSRPPGVAGITGQGSVCTLTFKAVAAGDSNLALVKVSARNSAQATLPAVGSQAVVHVK